MENKLWYAVQVGNNFDWDGDGSYDEAEARDMAQKYVEDEDYDGEEIRLAVIEEGNDPICIDEIIIREGNRE